MKHISIGSAKTNVTLPWKKTLHLFVVPNAVEDEHVKGAEAAPRALQDLGRLLGGNSTEL